MQQVTFQSVSQNNYKNIAGKKFSADLKKELCGLPHSAYLTVDQAESEKALLSNTQNNQRTPVDIFKLAYLQNQIRLGSDEKNRIASQTKISDIAQYGTQAQKTVACYFDTDENGIIDEKEAYNFNNSKFEKTGDYITITTPDGNSETYVKDCIDYGKEYYQSGTIPVAVIDLFTGNGYGGGYHGRGVCNMIKAYNPDISITAFNASKIKNYNDDQLLLYNFLVDHTDLWIKIDQDRGKNEFDIKQDSDFMKFLNEHPNLKYKLNSTRKINKFLDKNMIKDDLPGYIRSFKEVKKAMKNGAKFRAVNFSSGYETTFETINELCKDKIGEEITPDNAAKYKNEIKEILKENKNKTISMGERTQRRKISDILELIQLIEDIKVPVYCGAPYKEKNHTENVFPLIALADNALLVESGANVNGQKGTSFICSETSFSIDPKTGEKRIENSKSYNGEEFSNATTSFATPIALAKALKKTV